MKTEQELLEGIKNAREEYNKLSALLDTVGECLEEYRGELAKLKWAGLAVGKKVQLPSGKRYVVTAIRFSDYIEQGEKPWIYGVALKKDGTQSSRQRQCLFNAWTVEQQ
jgi:hypothetical protein